MVSLKSILPFWRQQVASSKASPGPLPAKPQDFGKASSFELLFDRLMDDPEMPRDSLFSTRNCRH
jgi:hypothetical protein